MAAARTGDRAALESLLRAHQPDIHRLCRRLMGNDADAADATQQALIAIVAGLPRFDGRATFSTWVYRVATNAALDEIRRRERRPRLLHGTVDEELATRHLARANHRGDPLLADQVADRLDLDAALEALAVEFRAVVVLRDVLGLDYAEIAEVLELPPGTVRSRISRGRAALARTLRTEGEAPREAGNQTGDPDVGRSGTS